MALCRRRKKTSCTLCTTVLLARYILLGFLANHIAVWGGTTCIVHDIVLHLSPSLRETVHMHGLDECHVLVSVMYMLDDATVLGMYMYVQPSVVSHYAPSTRYNPDVAAPRTDAESACFIDPSKYYGGGRHAITYYHYCGIVPPPSRGEGPSSRDTPIHVRLTLGVGVSVGGCPPVVVGLLHRLLRNLAHIRINASRNERQGKTQNKGETKYENETKTQDGDAPATERRTPSTSNTPQRQTPSSDSPRMHRAPRAGAGRGGF